MPIRPEKRKQQRRLPGERRQGLETHHVGKNGKKYVILQGKRPPEYYQMPLVSLDRKPENFEYQMAPARQKSRKLMEKRSETDRRKGDRRAK